MFYDLYLDLCNRKGISPTRAAIEIGISKSTPTTWKNRGLTPQGDTLYKIADYFGVTIDYLLGAENEKSPTPEGERLKSKLRSVARLEDSKITPEQDEQIADYIDFLLSKKKNDT